MRAKQLSLCVFIDAFGWELVKRHPFMDDVLPVKAPLNTIFGYSSTCDPTILTGKLPREHGHFTFFHYAPDSSPFWFYRVFGLLPRFLTRRGRVRHKMSQVMKRVHGYTGYFQLYNMPFNQLHLFDYSEKRDLYFPGGINSGHPTVFDHLRDKEIPFHFSRWSAPEEANLRSLEDSIRRDHPVFAYLFLAGMDAILHAHGTCSEQVARKIEWYEAKINGLMDLARREYESVRLFVFSDHGMTDINSICDVMGRIAALDLRFGRDYVAAYDSTMARFWFLNDRARDSITASLAQENQGRILTDAQLAEWGCDFPDHKYGQLFFLMNPGVLLCPSFMGEKPMAGMHGYDPADKDSVAAFMSSVSVEPMPNGLEDLYSLMRDEAEQGFRAG